MFTLKLDIIKLEARPAYTGRVFVIYNNSVKA